MSADQKNTHLEKMANTLMDILKDSIQSKANTTFTKDPEIVERDVIEYDSRMRTFGLEKFNGPSYLSAINFYTSDKEKENHNAVGALISFIEGENAEKYFKTIGFKEASEDDEETMLEVAGKFCKEIADELSSKSSGLGYGNVVMSDPISSKNDIAEGVEFNYGEYKFYELTFYIWKEKLIVFNITIAPPK